MRQGFLFYGILTIPVALNLNLRSLMYGSIGGIMLDKIGVFSIGATLPSWTRYRFVFRSDDINSSKHYEPVPVFSADWNMQRFIFLWLLKIKVRKQPLGSWTFSAQYLGSWSLLNTLYVITTERRAWSQVTICWFPRAERVDLNKASNTASSISWELCVLRQQDQRFYTVPVKFIETLLALNQSYYASMIQNYFLYYLVVGCIDYNYIVISNRLDLGETICWGTDITQLDGLLNTSQ